MEGGYKMMLDITAALRSPGEAIPFEHLEEMAETEVLGEKVVFPEPVLIKGTYSLVDEALIVRGRLTGTARGACARCLTPVDYRVDVRVDESFLRQDPREELTEDPWEERLVFSGNRVDLAQTALTLTMLDLPIRFLCSEQCQGMAETVPGEGPRQDEEPLDEAHPFSALRQLYTKFQEE